MKKVKNFLKRKPVYGALLVLFLGVVVFLSAGSADEVSKLEYVVVSSMTALISFDLGYDLAKEREKE